MMKKWFTCCKLSIKSKSLTKVILTKQNFPENLPDLSVEIFTEICVKSLDFLKSSNRNSSFVNQEQISLLILKTLNQQNSRFFVFASFENQTDISLMLSNLIFLKNHKYLKAVLKCEIFDSETYFESKLTNILNAWIFQEMKLSSILQNSYGTVKRNKNQTISSCFDFMSFIGFSEIQNFN